MSLNIVKKCVVVTSEAKNNWKQLITCQTISSCFITYTYTNINNEKCMPTARDGSSSSLLYKTK